MGLVAFASGRRSRAVAKKVLDIVVPQNKELVDLVDSSRVLGSYLAIYSHSTSKTFG